MRSAPFWNVKHVNCLHVNEVSVTNHQYKLRNILEGRSQWPRHLRRGSVAARLLGLWISGTWKSVFCECGVFSVRGLSVGLITPTEEFYRMLGECDREASIMKRPWPNRNCWPCMWGEEHPRTAKVSTTNVVTQNARKIY
jgi:hypothetical protein